MIVGMDIRSAKLVRSKSVSAKHITSPCPGLWFSSPYLDDFNIALDIQQKNPTCGIAQLSFHDIHRCIAAAQPHNLWRRTEKLIPVWVI